MTIPSSSPAAGCAARSRLAWAAAMLSVVALGWASRRFPGVLFPPVFGKYPGDALWTVMVFLGLGVAWPQASTWRLALWALAISFAVEVSQLSHAPWLLAIRATTLGRLALGTTFAWPDMGSYVVGAVVSGVGEWGVLGWLSRGRRRALGDAGSR